MAIASTSSSAVVGLSRAQWVFVPEVLELLHVLGVFHIVGAVVFAASDVQVHLVSSSTSLASPPFMDTFSSLATRLSGQSTHFVASTSTSCSAVFSLLWAEGVFVPEVLVLLLLFHTVGLIVFTASDVQVNFVCLGAVVSLRPGP